MADRRWSHLIGAGIAGGTLIVLNAISLPAQAVTYSTSATFSGGTGSTVCTPTQCTVGGFTLTYNGVGSATYVAPSLVDLGQFVTSFTPVGGSAALTQFTGVSFVLQVVQTSPASGVNNISDGITGQLAYNPSSSTLVWSPIVTSFSIGSATDRFAMNVGYTLVTDNTGNIMIQAPTTADNPNPTSVKANVSITPEPATFLLLASGLAGLGFATMIKRRSLRRA